MGAEDPTIDPQQQEPEAPGQQVGGEAIGDNPAWDPIRSSVDETTYQLIKPHLSKFDQDAQKRISSLNEKYGWAGKLVDSGMSPEEVEQAANLAQQLANDPVSVFTNLKGYVEQYYPDQFAQLDWVLRQQAAEQQDPNAQPSFDENEDPRLAEAQQRLEELEQRQAQWFAEQEQQRLYDEASAQIDAEYQQISAQRPDLTKDDWREIMGYAASQTQATGQPITVAKAVEWFDSIANRIRTTARPGDSAPDLLPLGGGNPARPQKVDYAKMSDQDIQAMIVADLEAKKKQS